MLFHGGPGFGLFGRDAGHAVVGPGKPNVLGADERLDGARLDRALEERDRSSQHVHGAATSATSATWVECRGAVFADHRPLRLRTER
jgi:hypothetical protein